MFPPLFQLVSSSTACTDLLGTNPVRFWPFDDARELPQLPYATWQILDGSPLNSISDLPCMDEFNCQVDVFARSVTEAGKVVAALRDALEPHCHITRWGSHEREAEIDGYRVNFDLYYFKQR